jgi:hypothetical protein
MLDWLQGRRDEFHIQLFEYNYDNNNLDRHRDINGDRNIHRNRYRNVDWDQYRNIDRNRYGNVDGDWYGNVDGDEYIERASHATIDRRGVYEDRGADWVAILRHGGLRRRKRVGHLLDRTEPEHSFDGRQQHGALQLRGMGERAVVAEGGQTELGQQLPLGFLCAS